MTFRAAYRLQLTPDEGFAHARTLVPYLRDLGVSHLYLSPSLQARAGSQHGYDVVDPRRISDELGGEEEFRALAAAGLGVILDIVPNHMYAGDENPFWREPAQREMFFDVDLRTGFHRRFFDVSELAGVKQEEWEVFWATHAKVIELARSGVIDGVRVDHPDGLANPREYFDRLREAGIEHVWIEKILEPGEELREWPVEGTTGYEFLNEVMALCVNRDAEDAFTSFYEEFTGDARRFEDIAALSKLEMAVNTFEPELRRLYEDVDVESLPLALASFHVYRTYIEHGVVSDLDRAEIARANVSHDLRRILEGTGFDDFVVRFQQTTGPVMAKGVEDTAFYRYFRLAALNEVGGSPDRFGLALDEFHAANAGRPPHGLLTTYTHDTKRSPDVRSRILALTWLADEWFDRVGAWHDALGGLDDRREELLVYQTLLGALPIERERLDGYLEKALREGKVTTNWLTPNVEHERAVQDFAARAAKVIAPDPFLDRVRTVGRRLALAQLLLKLTSPGFPDIYRGDELDDLSLVDPDNRRPVDWDARRRALREPTGKLAVIQRTLQFRATHERAFAGGYEPVDAGAGVCAFVRGGEVYVAAAVQPEAEVRFDGDVLGVEGLALGLV
ncbi:MAG TPA: alpha-amylase family glycosyl hydrolase [Gaiellaceae bacterium]|nr:alpha-amylase family glycosyl hydrolase [Gaiellaceae bacterium]